MRCRETYYQQSDVCELSCFCDSSPYFSCLKDRRLGHVFNVLIIHEINKNALIVVTSPWTRRSVAGIPISHTNRYSVGILVYRGYIYLYDEHTVLPSENINILVLRKDVDAY